MHVREIRLLFDFITLWWKKQRLSSEFHWILPAKAIEWRLHVFTIAFLSFFPYIK